MYPQKGTRPDRDISRANTILKISWLLTPATTSTATGIIAIRVTAVAIGEKTRGLMTATKTNVPKIKAIALAALDAASPPLHPFLAEIGLIGIGALPFVPS